MWPGPFLGEMELKRRSLKTGRAAGAAADSGAQTQTGYICLFFSFLVLFFPSSSSSRVCFSSCDYEDVLG